MTHPDDLLADYVDGTLPDRERAVVDAHLGTCPVCREEVELARSAVRALGTLEEAEVPLGVTGPVLREAGERGRRASFGPRSQWVAGLAAAAAIVAVIAISLGGPSGDGRIDASGPEAADGATEQQTSLAADVPLERQPGVNYDGEAGVEALATDAVRAFRAGEGEGPAAPSTSSAPTLGEDAADAETAFRAGDPVPALRCLRRGEVTEDPATSTLVRLIEARFEDRPAYLAVFLQSPGPGEPPERAVVWTVSRDDCSILNVSVLPFDSVG
jgi:Putative zinc-finger